MGIDGRLFPVSSIPEKAKTVKGQTPAFEQFMDAWYPIQVKQHERVGRPDIDAFEAMMIRKDRQKASSSRSTTRAMSSARSTASSANSGASSSP